MSLRSRRPRELKPGRRGLRGAGTDGGAGAMDDVLVQLLRENGCFFFSDLPKLYRLGKLERGPMPVRRFELAAWESALTYLAGAPVEVSSHEEVERLLPERPEGEAAAEGALRRPASGSS